MRKLEKMNSRLFESLKENELSQLGCLLGGYYTTSTDGGKDTTHHYETWSATNGDSGRKQDGKREDSTKTVQNSAVIGIPNPIDYESFAVTESLPDQG